VVSNPHIKRVYNAYFHAFETLRVYPPVKSVADNAAFCTLLRRLVDEHGRVLEVLARVVTWQGFSGLVLRRVAVRLYCVLLGGGVTAAFSACAAV
jgi:hypothetical protein